MKKIFFLFIILIGFKYSFSQGFQFGIKAGTDLNNITGESFSKKFTFGYHAGAFTQVSLSPTLSLQAELYYSEVNHDTATGFSTLLNLKPVSQIKLGYINVPLLLNIKPSKSLALQAGAQYGIVTQNNATVLANAKDAVKNGDFSALAGVQLYVANFRIYARYQVGLTNINDIGNLDNWKNQTVHVGVGLRLF
jgi:hypothetical protein